MLLSALMRMAAAGAPAPAPFSVEFELRSGGARVGTTRWTFDSPRPGVYLYTSRSEPAGLLSLFRKEAIVERSELELRDGLLRPRSYRYDRTGGKREKRVRIEFDWTEKVAVGTTRNGTSRLPIPDGAVDRLSYMLALMRDLAAGKRTLEYPVADGNRLRTYRFEPLGVATLDTALGRLEVVKLRRVRAGGKRETTVWFAKRLGFLPVAIEHRERDDPVIRLEVTAVEGFATLDPP